MKSFVAAAATVLCAIMSAAVVDARIADHIEYKTLTGYFLQDDPETNATGFDYAAHNFGLISREYPSSSASSASSASSYHTKTDWQRFAAHVSHLSHSTDRHTSYKVLFLGRHGEGVHNVAESYYGTPAWNCYWSVRDGNGTAVWADAQLTPAGAAQATRAHDFWRATMAAEKLPAPQSFYASPLTRCLRTAQLTFAGLGIHAWDKLRGSGGKHAGGSGGGAIIKEKLREGISGHTCDRRAARSAIVRAFPGFQVEAGFAEEDPLFQPLLQETPRDQDIRSRAVLDDIFRSDGATWVSVTSHSGEIASLLRVLGHRVFSLGTGQVIPVLVEARRVGGTGEVLEPEPYTPIATCAEEPPLPSAKVVDEV